MKVPQVGVSAGSTEMAIEQYIAQGSATVPGWFHPCDARILAALSDAQLRAGIVGDMLEIGCYLGKSAILLGHLVGPHALHVCDVFGAAGEDEPRSREQSRYYSDLQRDAFEANYLRFHPSLPVVHAHASGELDGLQPRSFRLIHVDGSHLYEQVLTDLELSLELLAHGGVIAVDDFRQPHTPGVAAALWGLVNSARLEVLIISKAKAYVCRAGDDLARRTLDEVVDEETRFRVVDTVIFGSAHADIRAVALAKTPKQPMSQGQRPRLRKLLRRVRARMKR